VKDKKDKLKMVRTFAVPKNFRSMQNVQRDWKRHPPDTVGKAMGTFFQALEAGGGAIGLALRHVGDKKKPLKKAIGEKNIFPIPFVDAKQVEKFAKNKTHSRPGLSTLAQGPAVEEQLVLWREWTNAIIVGLNLLYDGPGGDTASTRPSAAQQRCQEVVLGKVEDFVSEATSWPTSEEIQNCLRSSEAYSGGGGVAIPLGVEGGVPPTAGDVDTVKVLNEFYPKLAKQVEHPRELLLKVSERPEELKKPFVRVSKTYPAFVERCVKAGTHTLLSEKQVWKHGGKVLVQGTFAVRKPGADPSEGDPTKVETRVICAAVPANQLIDSSKMPRPVFGYIPRLRALQTTPRKWLLKSKRDARHYFHRLKLGRKWAKFLAQPPIGTGVDKRFPASTTIPMGFGPSAGWAQAVTDTATRKAELPPDKQVKFDEPAPPSFPIWGSIIDDIWAIAEVDKPKEVDEEVAGWMRAVDREWLEMSKTLVNEKKRVDGDGDAEIQGYALHPTRHWLGVSIEKRLLIAGAALDLMGQPQPRVQAVESVTGKFGFCHSVVPACRNIFCHIYPWCIGNREEKNWTAPWTSGAWGEIAMSVIMLPMCCCDLDAEWKTRLETSDAAPGGHGRAYAQVPKDTIKEMARWSDQRTPYTNLSSDIGIDLGEDGKCCMHRVSLPTVGHYMEVSRPGGFQHITLEEGDAMNWSLEDRLHRRGEVGCRVLQGGDNAANIGAYIKGRSPSGALEMRCRRAGAIQLAGGLIAFFIWVPTDKNWSDRASRVHSKEKHYEKPVVQAAKEVMIDLPKTWSLRERLFLHFCAGPCRAGDVGDWVEFECRDRGYNIASLRLDPCNFSDVDLVKLEVVQRFETLIEARHVVGSFTSPPCSTVSKARHKKLVDTQGNDIGPRPLRNRENVFQPLPELTDREFHSCSVGSVLALSCFNMLCLTVAFGGWGGNEHPSDPGAPYPSFFNSQAFENVLCWAGGRVYKLHQCRWGAASTKPTGIYFSHESTARPCLDTMRCNHRGGHAALIGKNGNDKFKTTAAARYTSDFAHMLADHFVDWFDGHGGQLEAIKPQAWERPWQSGELSVLSLERHRAAALWRRGGALQQ